MALTLLPTAAMAEETPAETPAGEVGTPAAENVAQIGTQGYETLAAAVAAVKDNETITLLSDVALDNTLTLDKNLILDLNGHIISNGDKLKTNYLVKVAYGAEVSIIGNKENSSISDTRTNPTGTITAICVLGELTVDGAELTISRGNNGIAIKVDESGADKLGKLTVKNGKVSSTQAIQNWGITTIDGGTFTGDVGSHAYSNIGGDLTINDGIFNGPVYSAQLKYNASWPTAQAKTKIVNGVFNGVVAEYYDDGTNGLQPVERSDKPNGAVNCKVAISGGTFSNLSCVKYMTADAKVTVDLNGKTVSGGADFYGGDLTIQNGTVEGTVWVNASTTDAQYNHLTVAADATIGKGDYAVVLYQVAADEKNFGSTIDVYGKLNGILWVQGNIKTDLKSAANPCVINVHDGAEIEDKTNSENVGIALNGAAILNVGKATIAGATGIEIRAGQLTLNGATVTGKNNSMVVKPNSSGTTTDGAGIAVAQHTTKLPIEVTINSGTISGYTAFYESNPQNNSTEDLAKVKLNITGGNFKTINGGTVAVYSADKTGFVTGGYFTSDPTAYLAEGKYVTKSDKAGYTHTVTDTKPTEAPVFVQENTEAKHGDSVSADIKNQMTTEVLGKTEVNGVADAVNEDALLNKVKVDVTDNAVNKVDVEVKVDVQLTGGDLSDGAKDKTLTFKAEPVATVTVTKANGDTETKSDVKVSNSMLNNNPITVKLPLPDGFTPKQILHKFTGGGYEYFINESVGGMRGAGSFKIEDNCAVFTIYGFSTFELSGKVTYVAPSYSGGSSSYDPTYSVSTPSKAEHGTVTVSPKSASKGDTVTVTVKPDSGYVLETLTVTDKNGNELTLKDKGDGKYTFTMPAGKVEVKATFMEDNSMLNFFYDVPNGAYFYEAVKWAVKSGVTNGLSDTMFGPYESCTRAQIVTFLWRAAGSPEPKTASSFTDVPANAYYAKAVAWAVENGITNGMTETTFAPDATCTRGQGVTFLHRVLKGTASGSTNFTDVKSDAFYADAINWAVANNVTNGTSNTTFSPNADCTRAEIVTFLYRAYQGK